MVNPLALTLLLVLVAIGSPAQNLPLDYSAPRPLRITEITVSGVEYLNTAALISISGLRVGDTIAVPGDEITQSINKLWGQGLFSDVQISATRIEGGDIALDIYLQELPRISAVEITGIRAGQVREIHELINLRVGSQATESVIGNAVRLIKNHYRDKGFLNTQVDVHQQADTVMANSVKLTLHIDRRERVRISDITFEGNTAFTDQRLRRTLKNTRRRDWNIFRASKFIDKDFRTDKESLIDFYNEEGFRDASVVRDSVFVVSPDRIGIHIWVDEGNRYHYRSIRWVGNTKFSNTHLSAMLGIEPGDVYNQTLLNKRLFEDENSITTTYMDQGYLFFRLEPVEVRVENDSVDIEMRIFEGDQATINRVIIQGNTKTHEHVIRRELMTKPGDLFSKTNITRSIRELAMMGHFDPEKLDVRPLPNPADGTVDLKYIVEEKASDQLEISGGWGQRMFVGTLGVRFSNFSIGRIFEPQAWRPVPSGDSQTLSIRGQTNGRHYRAFSLSFVEPWLGGRRPTNLSVSLYRTVQDRSRILFRPSDQHMKVTGAAVGLGTRLRFPDDFFTIYTELNYANYQLNDWQGYFMFSDGTSNNLSLTTTLSRNSVDQRIYPRRGSNLSLSVQLTPPYSLISGREFGPGTTMQEKYRWIEYHKWTAQFQWYNTIFHNLVLYTGAEFGFLGHYNPDIGHSPFEGFVLGGDGMSGYALYGRENIGLRGYANESLTPFANPAINIRMANIYNKFTMELRYPITLQPQAAIYLLAFVEAGNSWYEFHDFNPFNIHRSAGVGIRLFLPMIGMLGFDWGYGFDPVPGNPDAHRGQPHFIIGMPF